MFRFCIKRKIWPLVTIAPFDLTSAEVCLVRVTEKRAGCTGAGSWSNSFYEKQSKDAQELVLGQIVFTRNDQIIKLLTNSVTHELLTCFLITTTWVMMCCSLHWKFAWPNCIACGRPPWRIFGHEPSHQSTRQEAQLNLKLNTNSRHPHVIKLDFCILKVVCFPGTIQTNLSVQKEHACTLRNKPQTQSWCRPS